MSEIETRSSSPSPLSRLLDAAVTDNDHTHRGTEYKRKFANS